MKRLHIIYLNIQLWVILYVSGLKAPLNGSAHSVPEQETGKSAQSFHTIRRQLWIKNSLKLKKPCCIKSWLFESKLKLLLLKIHSPVDWKGCKGLQIMLKWHMIDFWGSKEFNEAASCESQIQHSFLMFFLIRIFSPTRFSESALVNWQRT